MNIIVIHLCCPCSGFVPILGFSLSWVCPCPGFVSVLGLSLCLGFVSVFGLSPFWACPCLGFVQCKMYQEKIGIMYEHYHNIFIMYFIYINIYICRIYVYIYMQGRILDFGQGRENQGAGKILPPLYPLLYTCIN